MGVAGRLVRDKGHAFLYKAFSSITKRHPGAYLLVAGSGPWEMQYAELGSSVKVLEALDPSQLVKFSNALDIFVNPTLRPQGSFVESLEMVIRDGLKRLHEKGMACKSYAMSMFTATKMASAYGRFFLCMKNSRYCSCPLHSDC
ncbi:hypothetical protein Syun_027839 [Stephania yunnanensis]|uniref:Uncharacterized protein n=1 Tax=Stephania yunnanensis TaxID=152371 RepID=A0AAP0ELT6_9MAGN